MMTRTYTSAPDKLARKETREFKVEFYYPENEGNAGQDSTAVFVICAEAVQGRNNPTGRFN